MLVSPFPLDDVVHASGAGVGGLFVAAGLLVPAVCRRARRQWERSLQATDSKSEADDRLPQSGGSSGRAAGAASDGPPGASTAGRSMYMNSITGRLEPGDHRVTVHRSALAIVEDASVTSSRPPPSGYEDRHQVIFPYWGFFGYTVGKKTWFIDPNQILFVTPTTEFEDCHPVEGLGHAAMIINPSEKIIDELCRGKPHGLFSAFVEGSRPMTRNTMLLGHRLRAFGDGQDQVERDECTLLALKSALAPGPERQIGGSRVVERAKELLHARGCERFSLEDIAAEVGASAVYLSQEFTRTQGMPLYRYLMMLRLNRALLELGHCNDITGLALDLGFSSHSHFSATFKRVFNMTPAQFRSMGTTEASRSSGRGVYWLRCA